MTTNIMLAAVGSAGLNSGYEERGCHCRCVRNGRRSLLQTLQFWPHARIQGAHLSPAMLSMREEGTISCCTSRRTFEEGLRQSCHCC